MEINSDHIISKAAQLYMKYGIKSVSMEDVARELGISKKTLYQFVKDKEDLIKKVIDFEFNFHVEEFDKMEKVGLNAIDEMIEATKFMNKMVKTHPPSMEYDMKKYYPLVYENFNKLRREYILNRVKRNLKKGVDEGLFRDDFDIEIISKLQAGRIEAVSSDNLFTSDELNSEKVFNELFSYHLHALCNSKGLDYFQKRIKC